MSPSKSHLIGGALAAALVASIGGLSYTVLATGRALPAKAVAVGEFIQTAEAGGDAVVHPVRDAKDPLQPDAPAETSPHPGTDADRGDTRRNVRIEAPSTEVTVDKERGKVRVRAPHTAVDVDPDQGRVRVRAPYVNLDIRW